MTPDDAVYMRLAIEEAKKGKGRTSPNPCVGAVILKDGTVVGRGYHRKAGTPHAEINAIADAGENVSGSTIYVTLEPCNHTGRTPPCTKAILDAGITRVVVGMTDPNPSVTGDGNTFLQSQGVEIQSGILEDECRELNRPFIKHIQTGMPWVVMKAGMSLDGKIAYTLGQGGKITGESSHRFTHKLRNTLDAILIGVDTAIIDDPSLNTRLPEEENTRDPLRIVLDSKLRLSPGAAILQQQSNAKTWIYCAPGASVERKGNLIEAGAVVNTVELTNEGRLDLREILLHLGTKGICSVLVEGGAAVHGSMLKQQLVDEMYLCTAPFFIGEQGVSLLSGYSTMIPETFVGLNIVECCMLGDDIMVHGFFQPRQNS